LQSPVDRGIAKRLVRVHAPSSDTGRGLAARISRRLSQVAGAPAPASETLGSAEFAGRNVTVQLRQEKRGTMLAPGCYAEVVVIGGVVRTAVRLPGNEATFSDGVTVASVFDLLGDRAAEAAERLARMASVPPSPLEIMMGEVKTLADLNLRLDPPEPSVETHVGGVVQASMRLFLGRP
jgi:O-phosphoseryl-tRNA(Cys) synthetase